MIEKELKEYGSDLYHKERWLVLTKVDLLSAEEKALLVKETQSMKMYFLSLQ